MNKRLSTLPPEAEKVFEGHTFDVYQWPQEMYDGSIQTFEKLQREDSTIVLAVTEQGKILVLEQEQPRKLPFIGFSGGQVEEGEDPEEGAKRELLEETGFSSTDLELIKAIQPSGRIDWNIHFYVARNCRKVADQALDPGEKITVLELEFSELVEYIMADRLRDQEMSNLILRALLDPIQMRQLEKLLNISL